MRNAVVAAAVLLLALLMPPGAAAEVTLLHCGTLIGVPGEAPQERVTIVVRGTAIERVEAGYADPGAFGEGVRVVDLRDEFVIPGLIDCHTHITSELPPMAERLLKRTKEGEPHRAIDGTVYARKTVDAGFTTIRNVGSYGLEVYALRDRIANGEVWGPRILAAGKSVCVTGGHADPTNGYWPTFLEPMTPSEGIADGPYEMRKAVRERIKQGSDLIKITSTGGVLSDTAAGVGQQMFEDEIRAVVETAATMGRKVACHAHGTDGINAALRGGVHSIEHGTYLTDESIELFRETGAYLVPTIHAGKFVADKSKDPKWFNPAIKAKAAAVGPQIQDSFARAYRGGVNIAFGTDVGVGAHGTNALEFDYMHEAGMTLEDCLISATISAADLCGRSGEIGSIEAGKSADIVALSMNPLETVEAYHNVSFVMAMGRTAD